MEYVKKKVLSGKCVFIGFKNVFKSVINDRQHVNKRFESVRVAHEYVNRQLSELLIFLYGHLSNCNFERFA